MNKYKNPTCRGSYALGTACGHCERCAEERPNKVNTGGASQKLIEDLIDIKTTLTKQAMEQQLEIAELTSQVEELKEIKNAFAKTNKIQFKSLLELQAVVDRIVNYEEDSAFSLEAFNNSGEVHSRHFRGWQLDEIVEYAAKHATGKSE